MSWHLKERLQKIVAAEQGTLAFAPGSRQPMALVYPNTYHVGMSNLGLHIIYEQINSRGDTACERLFLPDKKTLEEYIRTNTPLLSLENQTPLYEFPLIAFAVSFEMDYFNLLSILRTGKVPVLAADREDGDPLVIIGGPCATFNPEPLADFVDACIIGEGEEVIQDFLNSYYDSQRRGLSREELLLSLAQIEGIYVPRFYQPVYGVDGIIERYERHVNVPEQVNRRYVKDLGRYPGQTVIITSDTEFKDMYLIEVARGCGRHCRFCMAGYCFRNPRVRSLAQIAEGVEKAKLLRAKVGLMGAAISDYPEIDKLCQLILSQGVTMSVASLRADSLTPALVESLAASGHKTITLAPEAGSERMRKVINKQISDEHLYQAIAAAAIAGIPHVRLYIMVGLPGETTQDVEAIVKMAHNVKKHMESLGSRGLLTLSINPFIPKPFTPFQWLSMAPIGEVSGKLKYIQSALKPLKGVETLIEQPKEAYIQSVLARGDRRLGQVLYTAVTGGGMKGWKQALKTHEVDEDFYLYRNRSVDEVLPWNNLSMGFDSGYLLAEYRQSQAEKNTPPCAAGCKRCGVCQ
ncbi:TIGR03960 family B12-binding radical SAM protein [Sporomusa sp.]|uniref:TIGR03960 family B12-binding radical SAM protein n=1 Tax=Sporomusa sp. TaxID=2078658 RepID=UPI002C6DE1EF|nr:TIGR03960 family B12-binding radical SAM protein [Sporomusa sp.]HWR43245.1 TIGR03960 family B12-binding radical SAM protein [Sporomusa sp.]